MRPLGTQVTTASFAAQQTQRVTDLTIALAGTVSQLDEAHAQIADLEAELVAARSDADGWRDIAIHLAGKCRDLRDELTAARRGGLTESEPTNAR
jgi:hypothetical protein